MAVGIAGYNSTVDSKSWCPSCRRMGLRSIVGNFPKDADEKGNIESAIGIGKFRVHVGGVVDVATAYRL